MIFYWRIIYSKPNMWKSKKLICGKCFHSNKCTLKKSFGSISGFSTRFQPKFISQLYQKIEIAIVIWPIVSKYRWSCDRGFASALRNWWPTTKACGVSYLSILRAISVTCMWEEVLKYPTMPAIWVFLFHSFKSIPKCKLYSKILWDIGSTSSLL